MGAIGAVNAGMVTLTEKAAEHIKASLSKRGKGVGLRLAVGPSGCSGMSYKLEYADEREPDEVEFNSHGVTLLVNPKSLIYIQGTELDWVREGLNEGFKFNNPNVKNTCGCGESFSV